MVCSMEKLLSNILSRIPPCHSQFAWQYVKTDFSLSDGAKRRQGSLMKIYAQEDAECLQGTTSEEEADVCCSSRGGDGLTYQEFSVSRDAHTLE
jgi:hypothetical protein